MPNNILVDVNVCLDLLLDRKPYVESSGKLFEIAEKGQIRLFVSGLSFDTLFYIMRPAMGAEKAMNVLREFRAHVDVATVNSDVVDKALEAGWKDLEDALQYYCASENECGILITRNKSDFKKGNEPIKVFTPEEFME